MNISMEVLPTLEGSDCQSTTQTYIKQPYGNESLECDIKFKGFLKENRLVFGTYHIVRIVVTWTIFAISLIGNLSVLASVHRKRKGRDRIHAKTILTHLSLANLIFTLCILPMDAFWNQAMVWLGGDFLCRFMNMLKQFSMYISSSMIVVMSIDRVLILLQPTDSELCQKIRIKRLLIFAWVFSFICSLPGFIMFSAALYWPDKCGCPQHHIVQCVDFSLVQEDGRRIFYFYSMSLSFFIPLIFILGCYIIMVTTIRRMTKKAKDVERRSAGFRPPSHHKGLTRQGLARAQMVSMVVTVLITLVFVVSWAPYYIVGFIHWYNKEKPDKIIEAAMIMCSYLNPCLHPLVATLMLKRVRQNLPCTLFRQYKPARATLVVKDCGKRKELRLINGPEQI